MKKTVYLLAALLFASTAGHAQQSVFRSLKITDAGDAVQATLHLEPATPYTVTHDKAGKTFSILKDHSESLGTFPEAYSVKTLSDSLKNGWFADGLNAWEEERDADIPAPILERKTDAYLPAGAPDGAYFIQPRNTYSRDYTLLFYQTFTGLPAGTYEFSCQVAGYPEAKANEQLVAIDVTSEEEASGLDAATVEFPGGGWKTNTLSVEVPEGSIRFGVRIQTTTGGQNTSNLQGHKYANFQLVKVASE
ncbi:MAG: hypothetical protein LBK22_10105 [Tannerella sp.]|jgi:hypothetical protein|nr:hypothetical protein [Tannerella sp.]